jgi:hypothetical protein
MSSMTTNIKLMLKSEPRGAPKKRPLGSPLVQGIFEKSTSPVQIAER